jgi:hypothetical protein
VLIVIIHSCEHMHTHFDLAHASCCKDMSGCPYHTTAFAVHTLRCDGICSIGRGVQYTLPTQYACRSPALYDVLYVHGAVCAYTLCYVIASGHVLKCQRYFRCCRWSKRAWRPRTSSTSLASISQRHRLINLITHRRNLIMHRRCHTLAAVIRTDLNRWRLYLPRR